MLITKTIEIDMGHRVPNHRSKCRNLHGHRYKFEVGVDDKVIETYGASDEGMVIDFGDLKDIMMTVIDDKLDHGFMIYKDDPLFETFMQWKKDEDFKIITVMFVPTVENICRYVFYEMNGFLEEINIKLYHVKAWETPNSTAIFTINDIGKK